MWSAALLQCLALPQLLTVDLLRTTRWVMAPWRKIGLDSLPTTSISRRTPGYEIHDQKVYIAIPVHCFRISPTEEALICGWSLGGNSLVLYVPTNLIQLKLEFQACTSDKKTGQTKPFQNKCTHILCKYSGSTHAVYSGTLGQMALLLLTTCIFYSMHSSPPPPPPHPPRAPPPWANASCFFPMYVSQAAVVALAPVAMVSRRCTAKARSIFLREINEGGLVLLNEARLTIKHFRAYKILLSVLCSRCASAKFLFLPRLPTGVNVSYGFMWYLDSWGGI